MADLVRRCDGCDHWEPLEDDEVLTEDKKPKFGYCRGGLPTIDLGSENTPGMWPQTLAADWCAHFKPKPRG